MQLALCVPVHVARLAVSMSVPYDSSAPRVLRVGLTLAAGVITWAWSPIKFQADMGILLTFMFVWNMVGALVLIPALSHFLLDRRSTASAVTAHSAGATC